MVLRDLLELLSKEKKKKKRAKAAKKVQKFVVGIGAAATAGVAIGILLVPKSGKGTREDLKKSCKRCINYQGYRPEECRYGERFLCPCCSASM